jgi:hypothetical protein
MSATPSWIEVADRSAIVGIIECVRAGALTSEFKVVETWKGDEIRGTFHYRGSYSPGGRLLVCMEPVTRERQTYRHHLSSLLQPVGGGELPVSTWPEEAPEYFQSDFIVGSDIPLLPDGGGLVQHYFIRKNSTVSDFRDSLRALMASDESTREAILVHGASRILVEESSVLDRVIPQLPAKDGITLDQLLVALLNVENGLDPERVGWALGRAGGAHTLRHLESAQLEGDERAAWLATIVDTIRTRLDRESKGYVSDRQIWPESKLTKDEARTQLVKFAPTDGSSPEWIEAVLVLLDNDPTYLADYIAKFDTSPFLYWGASANFALWFAQNCPTDHVKCFRRLSKSKLSPVAAVGGLYLSFAEPKKGLALLEKWAKKPGPLSQWAADALVVHGRREYVAQALADINDIPLETYPKYPTLPPLATAVAAVLANAAHEAGLPLPVGAGPLQLPADGGALAWWKGNADKLVLQPLPFHWPIQEAKH